LGLSAKDFGKLIGVSSLTVYNWENGKSKPRRSQLPGIISVRGLGKREAIRRLEALAGTKRSRP
jgi:transcriptional regulator with XRE-family HTH domain